jgi:hypothetical protein
MKLLLSLFLFSFYNTYAQPSTAMLKPYIDVIKKEGKEPVAFIKEQLQQHDLILFDDAIHSALEPFVFYQQLISDKQFQFKVKYIFFEAFSINQQPALDAYINAKENDSTLLFPAFQNDFSGYGWRYQTYFDLLNTIRKVNTDLPANEKLRAIAVNAPVYWKEMNTTTDFDLFQLALSGNDYTMYKIMLSYMEDFKAGKKGIFLTNTRHAYKNIRDQQNQLFWNCGTFFYKNHPGKTYSVRFHNVVFSARLKAQPDNSIKTTEGLERYEIKWIRMDRGIWDAAFAANQNQPVALSLQNNVFGGTPYVGNHAAKAAPGQTMYDANDAVIFLAPLEQLHFSGQSGTIYTPAFQEELARRMQFLMTRDQLNKTLMEAKTTDIKAYILKTFTPVPVRPNSLVKLVGPIDEYQSTK